MKKNIVSIILCLGMMLYFSQVIRAQNAEHNAANYMNSLNNGSTYLPGTNGMVFQVTNGNTSVLHLNDIHVPSNYNSGSSSSGGGFLNWLGETFSSVANAIGDFFDTVFGSNDDGDPEDMGVEDDEEYSWEPDPDGGFWEPTDPEIDMSFLDDPFFQPPGFDQDDWDIAGNIDDYYDLYTGNYTVDCQNYVNGTAYVGSCGLCIGGFTGIPTCPADSARTDTLKATKVNCDSSANARGQKLTRIRDSLAGTADMQHMIDSAYHSPREAGMSITNTAGTYGTFNFQAGANNNVEVLTSSPGQNIVSGAHTHPIGSANSPSPGDLYHLSEGNQDNPSYMSDYVFPNDSSEWAIMMVDTTLNRAFLTLFPRDSTIQPPPVNDWDTTKIDPATGNKLHDVYLSLLKHLYVNLHYPIEMVAAYANVIMMDKVLKTGVKMYRKEGNEFRVLNVKITYDPDTGRVTAIEITICQ